MMRRSMFAALTAVAVLSSLPAFAQSNANPSGPPEQSGGLMDKSTHTYNPSITLWGFVPFNGIGAGARLTLPLIANGFIQDINDSFELELGVDAAFGAIGLGGGPVTLVDIPIEGRWTFHFTPSFLAYVKLGVGSVIYLSIYSGVTPYAVFYVEGAIGAQYDFSKNFGVRIEGGSHSLHLGIVLGF